MSFSDVCCELVVAGDIRFSRVLRRNSNSVFARQEHCLSQTFSPAAFIAICAKTSARPAAFR